MPPKGKRSKSPDAQFLFVNEDASTVTRTSKDAELDRTKQSHVQRQNFARKRRMREQSDSVALSGAQGSVPPSPSTAGPSTQDGLTSSAHYFDIIQNIDIGDSLFQSTSPPSVLQTPLDSRLSVLFSDPFTTAPTPPSLDSFAEHPYGGAQSYRTGYFFDVPLPPFPLGQATRSPGSIINTPMPLSRISSPPTSTQRALEQWAPPLIKHYNTIILPERFWKDTQKVPLARFRHAPLIHADMQACMSEPAHMYSFLASAAAQMIAVDARLRLPNVSEADTLRVPAFFKTKAIQALRTKLASGQLDHHTAVDIHRLYTAAIHTDSHEAAEPHFQALLSMIEALGGLSTFDAYQLEMVFMVDCNVALQRLGVPRLVVTLDPGTLPEQMLSEMGPQGPTHFAAGSPMDALLETFQQGTMLSESLTDLLQVVRVSAYLDSSPLYFHDYYKWFSSRTLVILHRLLSMPLHCELTDKADSVRIATAFWVAIARSPTTGRRTASRAVSLLRAKLQNTDLGALWQPHSNCLLWVSVFGGICCVEEDDLDWFVRLARTVASDLDVGNAHELEEVLTTFLYDPSSQRDLVLEFAVTIWSGR